MRDPLYHLFVKKSLGFEEDESIIPEFFFKTTIMIEPERIEFKNDEKI